MGQIPKRDLVEFASDLHDAMYDNLSTIDGGGSVTELELETALIAVINKMMQIPTLNQESQSYMIALRDSIREHSVAG